MKPELFFQRPKASLAAGLILAAVAHGPLAAQTNLETNAGVQFNFSTPGAGNMALGGAFLALAFDASAAYTNPAGLTTIAQPEALVEARHWTYTHVFTDKGRFPGQPSYNLGFDDREGLLDGKAQDQVTGLSYFSYVYPHRNWSFALYRHELVNFDANFSTSGPYIQSILSRTPLGIPGVLKNEGRLAPLKNHMEVDVTSYGAAAAYQMGGGLSLGLGISYFEFSMDSTALRFLPNLFSKPDFSPESFVNSQTQKGKDHQWSVSSGFLWESRQKKWSLGGVYRQGPDFTFRARSQQAYPTPEESPKYDPRDQPAFFHVPDVYGMGIAFRPKDAFRVAFDYDRIRYSQLTDGFTDIFGLATLPDVGEDHVARDPELDHFVIDDADELHLGMEYAFLQRWPVLSLRAGAWYDPDHSLRFEGRNLSYQAVFRRRGNYMHYTLGAGLAVRRLQIDAAIDHSERASVLSLSIGLRH
jgi:long-subunit fatty acid transport protein